MNEQQLRAAVAGSAVTDRALAALAELVEQDLAVAEAALRCGISLSHGRDSAVVRGLRRVAAEAAAAAAAAGGRSEALSAARSGLLQRAEAVGPPSASTEARRQQAEDEQRAEAFARLVELSLPGGGWGSSEGST